MEIVAARPNGADCTALAESARARPAPRKSPSPQLVVFVNADSPDRGLARELGQALAQLDVDCYWPIEAGTPD